MCLRRVLDVVRNDRTSNRRIVTASFARNSWERSCYKYPKLSVLPWDLGMLTRLPKCSLVPTLPLEEARSKLGFLFRLGSKMTDRRSRCSLRLPQRVRSKLHLPTSIWGASSLVSLKWSPRFRSAFARTHASSTWLSSLHRRARCPPNVHSGVLWSHRCAARLWWFNVLDFREFLQVCPSRFDNVIWRGWVLALCHGNRNSTHLNRLWIFSSLVSNTLNECLAGDVFVVWEVVSPVVVTGTDDVVCVLCTGGAPSASASGNRTRALSAADRLAVADVVSWMGTAIAAVVTASGSSGSVNRTLGIGPIRMGSRSLRTFKGLPRVTGVGFHGSHTMTFRRLGSQRRLSTLRFNARLRTMPFGVPIKRSSVLLSRPSQMPSSHADSSLLTNAPGRLHATASPTSRIGCW